jgi:hypothetical protein
LAKLRRGACEESLPKGDPGAFSIAKLWWLNGGLMMIYWESGWWFQTFFIFPYIGNNDPN